jgi:hypothetical protein
MQTKKYLGTVLLALMLLSSFAFVGSFYRQPTPTGSFSELTPEQERQLINSGKTIVFFNRPANCTECQEVANYLQELSIGYADQIVLVEKDSDSVVILVKSAYGQKVLGLATKQRITAVLCELMVNPPATCVSGEL